MVNDEKVLGLDVGWINDYVITRDNEYKWVVTHTYRGHAGWASPQNPVISIAPKLPWYDTEITQLGRGYYNYKVTWRERDNEVEYEDDPDNPSDGQSGAELDQSDDLNSFTCKRRINNYRTTPTPKI